MNVNKKSWHYKFLRWFCCESQMPTNAVAYILELFFTLVIFVLALPWMLVSILVLSFGVCIVVGIDKLCKLFPVSYSDGSDSPS